MKEAIVRPHVGVRVGNHGSSHTSITCLLLFSLLTAAANAAWPTNPLLALPICTARGDQEYPQIIADGAGGAIICWTDRRLGYPNLAACAQRVDAAGNTLWTSNGVSLYVAGTEQAWPMAASDGAGGAIVFYNQAAGVDQFPDLYAQHIDGSGAVRWNPRGVLVSGGPGGQFHEAVVPDGAGGSIVAWADGRGGQFQVFAQRLSANGEALWTPNGKQVTSNSVPQFIQMISDSTGGAILAWEEHRHYFGEIYAQRIDAMGQEQWAAEGILISPSQRWQQGFPWMTSDGAGGAIVCWQDSWADNGDIYAQRLAPNGTLLWPAEAVPVCTAFDMQSDVRAIADGAGGALITWRDQRNNAMSGADVYCQRLSPAGLPLWTSNGIPVCTATGFQWSPVFTTDGAGGAIITWLDQRNWRNEVFAQRIDSVGVCRWMPDGVAVSTASGNTFYPAIATDDAGGAFVVWPDNRNQQDFDIYANRLSPPTAHAGGPYSGKPGSPVVFTSAGSSDPAGDPLTFAWDFGDGSTAIAQAPAHTYTADGVYHATLTVSDGMIAVSDTATVTINTPRPPDCSHAKAIPNQLWPPDGELVPITIAGVVSPDARPITLFVTRVTQDEPLSRARTAVLGADGRVALLADRLGTGNGRVYTIWFTATDSAGLSTDCSVTVGVPHDKGRHSAAIDDGQNFTALDARRNNPKSALPTPPLRSRPVSVRAPASALQPVPRTVRASSLP